MPLGTLGALDVENHWVIIIDAKIYFPFKSLGNSLKISLKLSVCYMKTINAF